MNQASFSQFTNLLGLAKSKRANQLRQRKNRKLLIEGLENRQLLAAFQADSISVYRVGDGAAALGSAGTAVFIDEYSSTGTLLQSIALPTTTSGAQKRLVGAGSATSEGMLTRSADNNYLVLAGYDAALATATIAGTTSAVVNRVVGRIDGSGTVDTSTALTDAASGNNPRSVASTNGTDLWINGGAGGLRYTTFGSTTSTQINAAPGTNPLTNVRTTSIQSGQLYISTQSGSAVRVASVGTGTPTTVGQNTTPLPGLPISAGSPYQFFLADLDAGVAGVDTLYVADDTATVAGGILKYSLVGGTWTANGSVPGTNTTIAGNRGLTGKVSGSTVTLIGTSATTLFTVVDTTGYNATLTSPTITALATVGTNRAFRGVALSPVSATTQVSVAATDANKSEGNTGSSPTTPFTFTVTRSGPITGTSSVDYAITGSGGNPANAADFLGGVLPSGTVTFLANETTKTITIDVIGDTTPETDEGFTLTLSNPGGASIASATATGSILNDDAAATFAITATDAVKVEGNTGTTAFTFTVTRTGTTGTDTVDYAVLGFGGSAANATDFNAGVFPSGTLTFAPTIETQVITILVVGDTTVEPDEGFQVSLSNGSVGTAITTATATGSILNDDSLVSITGTTSVTLPEGNAGATTYTYTLTRTGNVSGSTDVSWSVAGSGTSPASESDFVGSALPSGTVSFLATETTKTISFDVQGDVVIEPTETFTLSLVSATNGAGVGAGTGLGTVTNDDFQSLAPGDIVITGINGDTPDQFSFVSLVDLTPSSQIVFTDNGWNGTALTTNEGTIVYTVPSGGLLAGTKVVVQYTSNTVLSVPAGPGTVTATGSFGLSTSGDSLLVFTGLSTNPNFLFGVTTFGDYTTPSTPNTTLLPSTLTIGTSAVAPLGPTVTTDVNNGQYNDASGTSGSLAAIRTLVANRANWLTSDTGLTLSTANFTVTGSTVTPTITATPLSKVYDGNAITISATADDGPGGNTADTSGFTYTYYALPNLGGASSPTPPKNVGSYSVDVAYAGNANYNAVGSTAFNFSITAASLPVTGLTGANKVYNANTVATVTGTASVTPFGSDVVTVGGTPVFAFADKSVANAKPITASGYTLGGADASNYVIVQPAGLSANITPFELTGSITAADKVFDGTTSATILTRTLATVFAGDTVSYVGGTATFATSSVGTGIAVTATGLSLSGADFNNYTVNTTATTTANITAANATVVTRGLRYFNATGSSASTSLATDKVALLPGQTSTFANYTNYSRGLNGIVVDINGLPSGTSNAQMLASLQFAQWDGIALAGFAALPGAAVPSASIAAGAGAGGSSRVTITFPDNTVQNTWLRVTVLANGDTGLSSNDVFYFGNVRGDFDVGNTAGAGGRIRVSVQDTVAVRNNQSTVANSASVTNIFDVNRDGAVTVQDTIFVRNNQQTTGLVAHIAAPSARAGSSARSANSGADGGSVPLFEGIGKNASEFAKKTVLPLPQQLSSTGDQSSLPADVNSIESKGTEIVATSAGSNERSKVESTDEVFSNFWDFAMLSR